MALPQTIDPTTLNISGKPAMATTTTPTTTSAGSLGMASPRVEDVKNEVSPALGALFGGMLGYAAQNRGSGAGAGAGGAGVGAGGAGANSTNPLGSLLTDLIKKATQGSGSGSSTPTGDIGSVNNVTFPPGTDQATIDAQYGTTNGQSNVVISGVNTSTGQVIGTPNYNIGGGNLSGTGSATGTQTEPSGGGYDSTLADTEQYFTNSNGDIYDYAGNLIFAYNNGYYMDPIDYSMYDATTFEPVEDGSVYQEFFDIPAFDSSGTTTLDGYDFADYSPSDWGSFWVKDGGSINKGGLPTPLFANGGGVKRFADGGTSFTDQVVANQVPVATASPTTATTDTTSSSFGDLISGLLSNKTLTGAGLGALVTALINSNSTQPVNKGVDMTALGTLKPRTTPVGGAAKFVPYSEYGTPTTPYDYSTLYNNLGVSPFGGSTGAVTPTLSPTAPVTTPTTPTAPVTTPTGGLPTAPTTPTAPTVTTPATTMPTFYTDADGNIYDADGNLVWDSTTSTMISSSPIAGTPVAPSSGLGTLAPTTSGDAYYSYGTAVTPSSVLGAKKGGAIKKMADGGSAHQYVNPFTGGNVSNEDVFNIIKQYIPLMEDADINKLIATDPYLAQAYFNNYYQLGEYNPSNSQQGSTSTAIDPFSDPASFVYKDPTTGDFAYPEYATDAIKDLADFTTSSTGTDFPPIMYNQGMPEQRQDLMPTQGNLMPTQGALMPQQGSAMPQQTPFSPSPTFRYSGANNPLLTGLRQGMPSQQPFMLNPAGQFVAREEISTPRTYGGYAEGGDIGPNIPYHVNPNIPNVIKGRIDYRNGSYVEGPGDGQSDDIPAMLADGEYVIDAETVAQLGNGSNKAGAKILDEFRENIRAHKRSAPTHKIPPKSKSALAYLKGAK